LNQNKINEHLGITKVDEYGSCSDGSTLPQASECFEVGSNFKRLSIQGDMKDEEEWYI